MGQVLSTSFVHDTMSYHSHFGKACSNNPEAKHDTHTTIILCLCAILCFTTDIKSVEEYKKSKTCMVQLVTESGHSWATGN